MNADLQHTEIKVASAELKKKESWCAPSGQSEDLQLPLKNSKDSASISFGRVIHF